MNRLALLVLIACLVVVGLIRASIPDALPTEYTVVPGDDGIARIDAATVELIDVQTARSVRLDDEFNEQEFTASPGTVLVVGRFRLVAHGRMFLARSEIRSSDGFIYDALSVNSFPRPGAVHVGLSLTTSYIFEVPVEHLGGGIGIHGSAPVGLQPVMPLMVFPLPDDLNDNPGEILVLKELMEPIQ